jgi:hypothetical protein
MTDTTAHLDRAWEAFQADAWQSLGQELAAVATLDPGILGRPASLPGQYWLLMVALGTAPSSLPTLEAAELADELWGKVDRMRQALQSPGVTAPPARVVGPMPRGPVVRTVARVSSGWGRCARRHLWRHKEDNLW